MASSSVMCSSSSTTSTVGRSGSVATAHTVRRAAAVRTGTGAFGGNSKERSRAFSGPGRTLSAMSQVAQAHPEPSTAKPLVVGTHRPATVEIVVPVYNEEAELEASVHSDVAIGTRLAPSARVIRGPKRELISRSYNLLLRTTLRSGFSDAQCGFKAVRTDVARTLVPMVEDEAWFFDTELLVLAEHNGLRIHEVPVDWVDDPDSRVDIVRTARDDLRGVARLLGQTALVRFLIIGVLST